jgi:hypothetical protein
LREKLEMVLNAARMEVLRFTHAQRKAESDELTGAAELRGITLWTKPELTGRWGGSH